MPAEPAATAEPTGRSARKHSDIIAAATALFLANGYERTSMDEVAANAGVSKQTVYKHFVDKEHLFGEVVLGSAGRADAFVESLAHVADTVDLPADLGALARRYIDTVIQERGLQLRRLVIGVADQFPELARRYFDRAPGRTVAALGEVFARLETRGLVAGEPEEMAAHFAYLILGRSLDEAMFLDTTPSKRELHRQAGAAAEAFLRAYART